MKVVRGLSILLLVWLSGCGFRVVATNPVEQIKQEKIRRYDPNDCSFRVTYFTDPNDNDPNSRHARIAWPNFAVEPNDPITVPYRLLEFAFGGWPLINGRLHSGKSIVVEVDTGCSVPFLMWDTVLRRNKIPVLPFYNKSGGSGVCDLPQLKVGELQFRNAPCFFLSQHLQFYWMGLPLWKQDIILMGLSALQQFSYVRFDNPGRRITFSKTQSFRPEVPDLWESCSMSIIRDPNSLSKRILLTISLTGQETEIGFDSGGGFLVMKETPFEALRPRLDIRSEKKGTFLSSQHGPLDCRRVRVRNLTIGRRFRRRTDIYVLPDDTKYLPPAEPGYLSLREFMDTVIVLDFKKNLFWIQNPKDLR